MSAKTTRFGITQQLIKSLKIQLLAVALVTFLPSSIFAQVAKSAEGKSNSVVLSGLIEKIYK